MNCPSCGHPNPSGSRFCNECGAQLDGEGEKPRVETPKHLAEKMRTGGAALAGERKQVTVMFADVQGSMELAERTDPEALRRIMDRFFAILCEGVHRFEGTVDKFTGDGIMAIFGAPIAHEDHALRACYAALHLEQELDDYATEVRRSEGLNFSVRIGLNSGEVVVGSIGEDLALSYTAIGHTVGLAQRMEQLAAPGTAYLTASTAALVEGFVELRDLGEFEVKGVSEPLQVQELAGAGEARTRFDVARARGLSRFVGRTEEIGALDDALERTRAGEGRVVAISGEPGVGKSRLCHEFAEGCRQRGIDVWRTAGLAHARSVPLLPTLQLMRDYFGVSERDAAQDVREKVAGRLLLLDPAFNDELPLLFDFLGVPDPARPAPGIDPEARKRRLLGLIRGFVHAESERNPGIAVIEDLHWIDPSSEEFLAGLVAAIAGTRTFVVTNFRPEYDSGWLEAPHVTRIDLEPLGEEAVAELLADLLGDHPSLDGLAELIRERTSGNPFFVEEAVQDLAESGTLAGERGAYRLTTTIEELKVPASVQAVLAARIDRLAEEHKVVLQAAAVIGKEFARSILSRVAEAEGDELDAALFALIGGEFAYERELYPEPVYSFKHPLTQEVAYGSLLAERRRALHAETARALAELRPERADEQAALIAGHWEAAGEELEAARWHARAAAWAGFKDPVPTLGHWQKVRELVEELPETDETAALDMTSRLWTMQFGWRLGISDQEAVELFERGREIAARRGDTTMLAMFHAIYGTTSSIKGKVERAEEQQQEAIRIADETGDPTLRIAMRPGASYVLFMRGRLTDALREVETGIEIGREDPSLGRGLGVTSPYAFCHMFRGGLLTNMGRLEEAADQFELAERITKEQGDFESETWHYCNRVQHDWIRGEPEMALSHATRGIELGERIGDVFSRSWVHSWLAIALQLNGRLEDAIAEMEESLRMSSDSGTGLDSEPWRLAWLADMLGEAGDHQRGVETANRALALCLERGAEGSRPQIQWTRARVLAGARGRDGVAEARAALDESSEFARRVGYGFGIHLNEVEYANLARLEGDEAAMERHLRDAQRGLAEIGATGRAAQTEEQLAALAG